MIKRSLLRIILVRIIVAVVLAIFGEVTIAATNVGRTAADFLLIGQGARAAGLGGAFTAVSTGATAAYWNPAGLAAMDNGQVALGHFSWFQDISVEQASLGFPVSDGLVAAVSITYVNYGTIEGYDISGNSTGQIAAYDWSGGVSLGYSLTESLALGLTGKYINQRLDDLSASAFAADIGLKYDAEAFTLAATVANLGSKLTFDQVPESLPATVRLGLALQPFSGAVGTSLEFEKRFQGDFVIRQGIELGFSERYFLRTGYDYLPAQDGRWLATGLSLGAGARFDFAEFDYAFTPNDKSTTEDLHRFTVTFLFSRD